ncbi:leucine--tRNA ligase [Candidatus Woesearchaeota archaeon]|nr:leucine--tRNA ligase [Candidatus Woesearchaeota archaeon]
MTTDFKEIEAKWQKKWEQAKIFEPNINNKRKKFFFTTPYPYISGSLHIGHGRAVIESDIYVRYLRMKNYNVLYPLAFHITGTPVLGISLAIRNNDQKKKELYRSYIKNYVQDEKQAEKVLESFKEPWNIVNFFLPKMMDEYKALGLSVDWTRRFTTGDKDYQQLITWQFHKYKEKNYLMKGEYPVLYCPQCKNAVGEDDIQDADTNPVEKQEFTLLKLKYKESFLVAATLRPETVFGQTNLWVNPDTDYVKAEVNDEIWIASREGFEKLKYQGKQIKILGEVKGKNFIGHHCIAPLTQKELMILPSELCNPNIGTGIVTSVPSHAPADWIALEELQHNQELLKLYSLNIQEVRKIRPISLIHINGYGEHPAHEICQRLRIKSMKDSSLLEQAKKELYKEEHFQGVMKANTGRYHGMKVEKARDLVKKDLLAKKEADLFYETSRESFCRDGTKIVVAIMPDQWFLDFSSKGWKAKAKKCLNSMELLPESIRKNFLDTFSWLDKRPTARRRGIGTPLPFDRSWIIESLSDSTIYMSFYTIKNIINKYKITAEQLSLNVFDYIFLGKGTSQKIAKETKIPAKALEELKKNFNYWYPNDHRHTFQAHLSNHLSFFIFAHAAIFPEKYWPKKISLHGFVLSEGTKMSKSKGNIITILDVQKNYSADVLRSYISTATNIEGTFNWQSKEADNMKKTLESIYEMILDGIKNRKKEILQFRGKAFISKFNRLILEADKNLKEMKLRDYGQIVLYQIPNNLKKLQKSVSQNEVAGVYSLIIDDWIKLLMPITPHLAEELWEKSGKSSFVSLESFPRYDAKKVDLKLEAAEKLTTQARIDISTVLSLVKIKPNKLTLFVAEPWKFNLCRKLQKQLEKTRDIKKIMKASIDKKQKAESARIIPSILKNPTKLPEIILDQKTEISILKEMKESIEKEFALKVEITLAEKSQEEKARQAFPGKPAILVE